MLENFQEITLLENTLTQWAVAIGIGFALFIVFKAALLLIVTRLQRLAQKTPTIWDNAITKALSKTRNIPMVVVAFFAASYYLELPSKIHAVLLAILSVALIAQAGLWANNIASHWLHHENARRREEDPGSIATITAIGFLVRLVLWVVVLLLLLDNVGVDVTALVAGLGVGGIAIALALQNILGDLFASLSILLDKPFTVGDFVIVDEHLGVVDTVGLKTTRIRSLSGEQLVFSNADLLQSRIRNFGRMFERRVPFKIGVTYQTPRDKIELIPIICREAVELQESIRFDRAHFKEYGEYALNFEIVYYILSPDYNIYMDIQQAINLHIHKRFDEEGIEFAYPTRTLFLGKNSDLS